MTKDALFPEYFDILNVEYFYKGDQFETTAEQDDYIYKCIMHHDKMLKQLYELRKLISEASEEGFVTEELFLSQAETSKILRMVEED